MRLLDLLNVYTPLLAETGVILAIVVVLVSQLTGARGGTSSTWLLLAIIVVGVALLGGGVVLGVGGALRRGFYATGEVVGSSGMTARLRVSVRGQDSEVVLRSRASYRPGSRLDVMVDPVKGQVLLVIGAPTT